MAKLENDILTGGRLWSNTTNGKIIDAEQIDGKLKMEQIEGLTEAITEIDRKFEDLDFEALDFEALDSDFFNSIY